jgi:hypothetical protein
VNRLPTVIGALVIASVIPILLIAAFGLIGTVAAVCIAVVALLLGIVIIVIGDS